MCLVLVWLMWWVVQWSECWVYDRALCSLLKFSNKERPWRADLFSCSYFSQICICENCWVGCPSGPQPQPFVTFCIHKPTLVVISIRFHMYAAEAGASPTSPRNKSATVSVLTQLSLRHNLEHSLTIVFPVFHTVCDGSGRHELMSKTRARLCLWL